MSTQNMARLICLFAPMILMNCGEPETIEELEVTTGCAQSDTPPDPDLEGKWTLDEVVCFDDTLEEVVTIAMFSSLSATIEARGSCTISVLDDGYCSAIIGGSFSIPEESIVTVSSATVLDLSDGTDTCYFSDYLEGLYGYSPYNLVDNWLDIEYSRDETFPEYSQIYIKADDASWVLFENPAFTPYAGGYCFSSYSKDSSGEDSRKVLNQKQSMLNLARKKLAIRKGLMRKH